MTHEADVRRVLEMPRRVPKEIRRFDFEYLLGWVAGWLISMAFVFFVYRLLHMVVTKWALLMELR